MVSGRFLLRDAYDDLVVQPVLWHLDRVSLLSRDLSDMTHIVSTRSGLFAASQTGCRMIARGQYFGISYHSSTLYCFQQLGPRDRYRGRVIALVMNGHVIEDAYCAVKGLPSGCHQIDFIGDELYIVDTDHTRILKLDAEFSAMTDYPLFLGQPYPHINSVIARDEHIYILKHNGNRARSEIACFDRELNLLSCTELPGYACHNLVFTRAGDILVCDSRGGRLITPEGPVVELDSTFTRGLSVDDDSVVVGGNAFCERSYRRHATGKLFFLDAAYRLRAAYDIPGGPTEIRKIDGRDRSLSNAHRPRGGARPSPPEPSVPAPRI